MNMRQEAIAYVNGNPVCARPPNKIGEYAELGGVTRKYNVWSLLSFLSTFLSFERASFRNSFAENLEEAFVFDNFYFLAYFLSLFVPDTVFLYHQGSFGLFEKIFCRRPSPTSVFGGRTFGLRRQFSFKLLFYPKIILFSINVKQISNLFFLKTSK